MTRLRPTFGIRCLVVAALAAFASDAAVADVFENPDTTATLAWAPAAGPVESYAVWVARNGEPFAEPLGAPTIVAAEPAATVTGEFGETFQVRVAAARAGTFGPLSDPSPVIRFVPPKVVPGDLDGNGVQDALFESTSQPGRSAAWLMTADGPWLQDVLSEHTDFDPGSWELAGSTDVDHNGSADLLWAHEESGSADLWLVSGTRVLQVLSLAVRGNGWQPHLSAHRSPTGAARVLWIHRPTGVTEVWEVMLENGELVIDAEAELMPMSASQGWRIVGTCDLDGNGVGDVLWHDAATGARRLWLMDAFAVQLEMVDYVGTDRYVGCADFTGDGVESLVRENTSRRRYTVWTFRKKDSRGFADGLAEEVRRGRGDWSLVQAADMNGDGVADLLEWSAERSEMRMTTLTDLKPVTDETKLLPAPPGHRPMTLW